MRISRLTAAMPEGSYLRPEVSHDGSTVYFGFCPCDTSPRSWRDPESMDRRYHLYALEADTRPVENPLVDRLTNLGLDWSKLGVEPSSPTSSDGPLIQLEQLDVLERTFTSIGAANSLKISSSKAADQELLKWINAL